ncbi:carbohydrate ABC transporter permease [Niameybacter massiliensis]|uniref:Carbohydrate ABC transporter permease n=2 Tax=Clostridia TaxID=186801 RepID=A0AA42DMW0_9FIRM|nr:carbohydrate ABC transporter permease [Holtiella tumoricola]MDA3731920.1 carbohydrate ABC transporter permease [Holtiella tumoricola]
MMVVRDGISRKIFNVFNILVLVCITLLCILPFIHLFALSLSGSAAASAGKVGLWPVDFTLKSYEFLLEKSDFIVSLGVTLKRVFLGTIINMTLVVLTAYPLSKSSSQLKYRTALAWFFVFTNFFSGGTIPNFILIRNLQLFDSIWALVLPGAVAVGNVVLLLNFFRSIPKSLEEAAMIDGASQFTILFKVFLPVSKPALATILLFTIVGHWNAWFDGILYMNSPANYPLQSYLSTLNVNINTSLMTSEELAIMKNVSDETLKSAQIFLGTLPIMLVYPFLQKYFVKGIVLGSVKE